MKIATQLVIFCVLCCAAAAPASAYYVREVNGISRELSKGFDKIVELMNSDSDQSSLIKEMTILAFEKRVAKEITKKQKNIKRCLSEIDDLREYHTGDDLAILIDEELAKITALEKEIAQYTEFQNKIQAWKNSTN